MIFWESVVGVFWPLSQPSVSLVTFIILKKTRQISILPYYIQFNENMIKNRFYNMQTNFSDNFLIKTKVLPLQFFSNLMFLSLEKYGLLASSKRHHKNQTVMVEQFGKITISKYFDKTYCKTFKYQFLTLPYQNKSGYC